MDIEIAIEELRQENKQLRAELEALKARLDALERQVLVTPQQAIAATGLASKRLLEDPMP